MAYKEGEEYLKIKYNPMVVSKMKRIWNVYPDFKRRPILCSIPPDSEELENFDLLDLDKLLKFVVLFIDPLSPFANEKNFDIRIKASLDALGYSTKLLFYRQVRDNTEYFQEILFEYFKMIHSLRYETWFSINSSFHISNKELRQEGLDAKKRVDISRSQIDNLDMITKLENSLFPDELTKKIIADKATQGMKGYAEKYALELEDY